MKRVCLALSFVLLVGCGVDNAAVGGRCRDDLAEVGGACVAVAAPPVNVIDPGAAPPGSRPPPSSTATPPSPGDDAGATEPPAPTGATVDGGTMTGAVASDPAPSPSPSPPSPPTPPALACDPPLVACHGACIPVDSDPLNCGACGKICPSNICVAGVCQGATPGDVVLVGEDFTQTRLGSAQAQVLVNAMSIPTTDPIRVLSWETGADASAVTQVRSLLTSSIRGRGISFTVASASDLASPALARSYDIVLLHDASTDDPATFGSSLRDSLPGFAHAGGVVVAIDGGASRMPELVAAASLFAIGGHDPLASGAHFLVSAPGDVVGSEVLSPYAPFGTSVGFTGLPDAADVTVVVRDEASGAPVVLHRVIP